MEATVDLRAEREILATEYERCDPDAYPGSKAWQRLYAAERALMAFDREHPEVIAELRAARAAGLDHDAITRKLRGED